MSSENPNELADELAKSLQVTTSMVQTLLTEIQTNATTMAVLQEKLDSLGQQVKSLSYIIRDGNGKGSLVTRFAVMEKDFQDLEEQVDEYKKKVEKEMAANTTYIRDRNLSMWKILAIATPGVISLIITIIKLFAGEAP